MVVHTTVRREHPDGSFVSASRLLECGSSLIRSSLSLLLPTFCSSVFSVPSCDAACTHGLEVLLISTSGAFLILAQ